MTRDQSRQYLVYGLWRGQTLVVLGADWAQQAVREIDRWEAASTVSEALALATAPESVLNSPIDIEDYEGFDPDEPFDLNDCGTVNDGDWPGMPAQQTTDWLPAAETLGAWVETIFNGRYLQISIDREGDLARLATASDLSLTRDDALINRAARWP